MALQLNITRSEGRVKAAEECAKKLWSIYLSEGGAAAAKALADLKNECSSEFGTGEVVSNADVIRCLHDTHQASAQVDELTRAIRKSPGRALSGVTVVAIMTAPAWCPGQCVYCPTSAIAAKSYTGFEPAARRARANDFDSYRQVESRLRQFVDNGHNPSKCELIVMGGTFNSLPLDYQRSFLKGAYDAFNESTSASLEDAILCNETAPVRVIGLVIETRPDWATPGQVRELLDWGTTRIELGIQSLDDVVLEKTKRGHGVAESIAATKTCKDLFLKVGYHIMLGVYSTAAKEAQELPHIFSDSVFRPDMLKIYPTLVIPGTELYDQWRSGEYEPYTTQEVVDVICEIKRNCPQYVRIMRIDRDIPTPQIAAGIKETNLREIVQQSMLEKGKRTR